MLYARRDELEMRKPSWSAWGAILREVPRGFVPCTRALAAPSVRPSIPTSNLPAHRTRSISIMTRRNPSAALGLAVVLAGCSDQILVEATATLLLDGEVTVSEAPDGLLDVAFSFEFSNGRRGSVFVARCDETPPPSLLRETPDGRWAFAWSPVRTLCTGAPLRIEPGEVYRGSANAQIDPSLLPGRFRLTWEVLQSYDAGQRPPGPRLEESQSTSQSFEVVSPAGANPLGPSAPIRSRRSKR